MKYRTLFFYGGYFDKFYDGLKPKIRLKVIWTLKLLEEVEIIPKQYFKYLQGTDGLYEVKVVHGRDSFRVFCFFDQGKIVVLCNGFRKKSR